MNRRHFISHLSGSAVACSTAIDFTNTLLANTDSLRKQKKSAILLWMSGGPSTMDIWDLKPGTSTGGPFRSIDTSANGIQICEHMPLMAKQMHHMNIVRSMSTREADHMRGRYYMHTGYVPNPNIEHPGYGSVISHELISQTIDLEIPPFVSVGGGSVGPGFLGMTYAPFVVNSNGNVRDLNMSMEYSRIEQRLQMLKTIEDRFINERRGDYANDHLKMIHKTVKLMTSKQMDAFKIVKESDSIKERYGNTNFGRGCLIARRLVQEGVPFIEVDLGGWDNHNDIFPTLQNQKLPELDRAMSALIEDLNNNGLLETTTIVWMGEFGRTPNINKNGGRDHWAKSWSVVVGGGNLKKGIIVGETSKDGKETTTDPYTSQDLMATVLRSLDISLDTTFLAKNGRPMKIANSGRIIKELT